MTPLGSTGEFAYLTMRSARLWCRPRSTRRAAACRSWPASLRRRLECGGARRGPIRNSAPTASWILEAYFRWPMRRSNPFLQHCGRGRHPRRDLTPIAIPALRSHARRHRASRGPSAPSATSRMLDQHRTVVVDHEPLRRCDQSVLGSAHIPAAVMLIGGVGWMAGPACIIPRRASSSIISARPNAGTTRCGCSASSARQRGLARFNLAACIKAGLSIQATTSATPCRRRRLTDEQRGVVEAVLQELG